MGVERQVAPRSVENTSAYSRPVYVVFSCPPEGNRLAGAARYIVYWLDASKRSSNQFE